MAGKGMLAIKHRIRSVNSTKQITKAMELVSSAKLKRARDKFDSIEPYFNTIQKTVTEILRNADNIKSEFFAGREIKKSCYVVITADKGLCGGFNSGVLKESAMKMKEKETASVIVIGQKAKGFFAKTKHDIDGEYVNVLDGDIFKNSQKISSLIIQLYKEKMVDEVFLVYTNFISTLSQRPKTIRLLPFEKIEEEEEEDNKLPESTNYVPSPEGLFGYLVPKYIQAIIYGALIESSVSEQAARRIAMENATDNAEDMIDNLTLHYNRARQAAITQEISEIVAGADALE